MPNYPSRVHSNMSTYIDNVDDILPPSLLINKDKKIATRNAGTEIDENFSKSGTKFNELDVGNWQRLYNQTYCSTVYDPMLDFGPQKDDVSLIDAETVKPKRNHHAILLYRMLGILLIICFVAVVICTVLSLEIGESITVKLSAIKSKSCSQENINEKDGLIVLC